MKLAVIGLGLVFFLVIVIGLFLPTQFSRSRTLTIQAEPARIHALVADLERWPEWTPWDKDPSLTVTLGSITRGAGATRTWTGGERVEELKILTSDPAAGITYTMTYRRGSEATVMHGALSWRGSGAATEVTWSSAGDMRVPVLGGYLVLAGAGPMDAMFDRGLSKLKQLAEAR